MRLWMLKIGWKENAYTPPGFFFGLYDYVICHFLMANHIYIRDNETRLDKNQQLRYQNKATKSTHCYIANIVILSEIFTLLIWVLEFFLYFTWLFLMTRPFRGYHHFFTLFPLPCTFFAVENFNLDNSFSTVTTSARALIFYIFILTLWQDLSVGTDMFYP